MNIKDIIFDINKKVKNEFLIYIENEFNKTIEMLKLDIFKKIKIIINDDEFYNNVLTDSKKRLILQIDKGFYDDTKKELYKFISYNYKNYFNKEQLEFITDKILNFYYPSIKEIYINYINSI